MSPSLRESLRVALCPEQVAHVRRSRGLRPKVLDRGALAVEGAIGTEPWRPALDTLSKALPALAIRPAEAAVVLSNHFVRYVLLDAETRITNRQEWQEYAAHRFEKIHGERSRAWDIRVAEAEAGQPRLASAIDRALLEAIIATFANTRARLRSVEPYFMAAFNRALPGVKPVSFWFVVREPGQLLLGLVRDGLWRSIRGRSTGEDWRDELPPTIQRENALLAPEDPCGEVVLIAEDLQAMVGA